MKYLTLLLLASAVLPADTLPTIPVLTPDGQTIGVSPELGANIFAIPGSMWSVWFNDNPNNSAPNDGHGDFDFNDAVVNVSFTTTDVTINFLAENSANANQVWGGWGGGWLTAGQSSTFTTWVGGEVFAIAMQTPANDLFISGPWNMDGAAHAWVARMDGVEGGGTDAPEPGTMLMMGAGIGLVVLGRLRKRINRNIV